jgi:hypothetical protein
MELALFRLMHKLLGTDTTTATIIFHSGIDIRTMRGIIVELARHRLTKEDADKISAFMRRTKNVATKRNRIVHGMWTINVILGPPPRPKPLKAESAEFVRRYFPPDSKAIHDLNSRRSQKAVAAYEFSPGRLESIADEVEKLAKEMTAFIEPLALRPASNPQPVEW